MLSRNLRASALARTIRFNRAASAKASAVTPAKPASDTSDTLPEVATSVLGSWGLYGISLWFFVSAVLVSAPLFALISVYKAILASGNPD